MARVEKPLQKGVVEIEKHATRIEQRRSWRAGRFILEPQPATWTRLVRCVRRSRRRRSTRTRRPRPPSRRARIRSSPTIVRKSFGLTRSQNSSLHGRVGGASRGRRLIRISAGGGRQRSCVAGVTRFVEREESAEIRRGLFGRDLGEHRRGLLRVLPTSGASTRSTSHVARSA